MVSSSFQLPVICPNIYFCVLASSRGCDRKVWEAQDQPFILLPSKPFSARHFSPVSSSVRPLDTDLLPFACSSLSLSLTQVLVMISRQQRSQPQLSWGQGWTRVDVISFLSSESVMSSLTIGLILISLFRFVYCVTRSKQKVSCSRFSLIWLSKQSRVDLVVCL